MRARTRRQVLAGAGCALLAAPSLLRAAEPLRFDGPWGETVLDRPAARVVSLGYTTQDPLLALGVVPLAVREWFGGQPHAVWPWAEDRLRGAAPAVLTGEVSMELVAGLEPDLIVGIGSGLSRAEYELLSRIAPVLMQEPDQPAFGSPWRADTRRIARATGQSDRAARLITGVEESFAAARRRHPGWQGATAVAAWQNGGQTGAFMPGDSRAQFFAGLGFTLPPALQELAAIDGFYTTLSPEDLSPLDADLLVWISSFSGAEAIAQLPMRRTLDAHREGREVFADEVTAAALSFGSVLSLPFALNRLEAEIAAALDGRPETVVPSARAARLLP
ncbi:twin-arginine translocation pathway signal protein [Roseovarius sp. HI0049]|nr:twin-arginine translocation pathway signal protein [Roseovarius sp. HI0049]